MELPPLPPLTEITVASGSIARSRSGPITSKEKSPFTRILADWLYVPADLMGSNYIITPPVTRSIIFRSRHSILQIWSGFIIQNSLAYSFQLEPLSGLKLSHLAHRTCVFCAKERCWLPTCPICHIDTRDYFAYVWFRPILFKYMYNNPYYTLALHYQCQRIACTKQKALFKCK